MLCRAVIQEVTEAAFGVIPKGKVCLQTACPVTVAKNTGMGARINTIMQTCFFAISGILPKDEAIQKIKDAIQKTYGVKGEEIVKKNFNAVDQTLENLFKIEIPASVTSTLEFPPIVSDKAPDYVKDVLAKIMEGKDSIGGKEALEGQIRGYKYKKGLVFNKLVSLYLSDTVNSWANDSLDELGPALLSLTGYDDRLRMHYLIAHVNAHPTKTSVSFMWMGPDVMAIMERTMLGWTRLCWPGKFRDDRFLSNG